MGYNTAKAEACRLLQNTTICQTIDAMRKERNERLNINADDTLRKIKLLSEYDASDFFDYGGNLKPLADLHPDLRFVVEGMDVTERGGEEPSRLMKIKLPRKKEALELLAKCQQMLGDKAKEDDETPPPTKVEIVISDARK